MCTPPVQFEYSTRDLARNKPTREVNCKIDEPLSEHCAYVTGSIILHPRIKTAIVSLFKDGISYVGDLATLHVLNFTLKIRCRSVTFTLCVGLPS